MSILDLVVILIIANGVQNAMVGENTTLVGGLDLGRDPDHPRPRAQRRPEAEPRGWRGSSRASRSSWSAAAGSCRAGPAAARRIDRAELDAAVRAHGVASVSDVQPGRPRDRRLDQRDPARGRRLNRPAGRADRQPVAGRVEDVAPEEGHDPRSRRRAGSRDAPSRGPRRRTSGPRGACPRSSAPRPSARSSAARPACPCGRGGAARAPRSARRGRPASRAGRPPRAPGRRGRPSSGGGRAGRADRRAGSSRRSPSRRTGRPRPATATGASTSAHSAR